VPPTIDTTSVTQKTQYASTFSNNNPYDEFTSANVDFSTEDVEAALQEKFNYAEASVELHPKSIPFTANGKDRLVKEWNAVETKSMKKTYREVAVDRQRGGRAKPRKGSYESMTVKELRKRAEARGVSWRGTDKAGLIARLRRA
jgi:hypothetical protein